MCASMAYVCCHVTILVSSRFSRVDVVIQSLSLPVGEFMYY